MLKGEQKEGSLIDHLEELRSKLLRMIFAVILCYPVVFYFSDFLLEQLINFTCPDGITLRYFSPIEPLLVRLKLAFYLSMLISSAYLLLQIWNFVAPGLYKNERKTFALLVSISWLLFIIGGIFGIMAVLPLVMNFSLGFSTIYLQPAIGIGQFISLSMMLIAGFGMMFQFPVAVFFIVSTGLISLDLLKSYRAVVFVFILILSALLTPPDVVSQLIMGFPAYALFEMGLFAATLAGRKRKSFGKVKEKAENVTKDC